MKFDSIILIGPSPGLQPLVTEYVSNAELSFLGTPLLNHAINYVGPHSAQIFIFCLERYRNNIHALIKNSQFPIEVITTHAYEGFGHCLNLIKTRLTKESFILCHADMYFYGTLHSIVECYKENNVEVLVSFFRFPGDNNIMTLTDMGDLISYNSEKIPFLENAHITMSMEYKLKNFFICKSSVIKNIPVDAFSFKNNVIPILLENRKKIKLIKTSHLLISQIKDYKKQLDVKNNELNSTVNSICHESISMDETSDIQGSIVGSGCVIHKHCRIGESIIMEDVTICDNCVVYKCILGKGAVVCEGSRLVNCNIGPFYRFAVPVDATNENISV